MASLGHEARRSPKSGTPEAELELRQRRQYSAKRANARRNFLDFDILFEDIEFPAECPVLRHTINYFAEPGAPDAASFDRVDPKQGYVNGNVRVISMRANRLKSDASLAELEALVEYVRNHGD